MTESEQSTIKHLHKILLFAIGLLVVAEVSSLVMSSGKYIFTVIVAVLLATIQWVYWHKQGSSSFRKVMVVTVLLLTVLGPIIFFIIKWLFWGESILGIELVISLSFVTPILLMLYIDKSLTQLL
ncbi:MAG: hypothetical protein KAG18_03520 [Sinobacterium sp.]|nr:hypothetical protein [Sinobacterium sp.]